MAVRHNLKHVGWFFKGSGETCVGAGAQTLSALLAMATLLSGATIIGLPLARHLVDATLNYSQIAHNRMEHGKETLERAFHSCPTT